MRTNKKLNLNSLKVESFITSMNDEKSNTVKAGSSGGCILTISLVTYTIQVTRTKNTINPNC